MASKNLKKYKVGCHETVHAFIYVNANSKTDALKKAHTILDEQGMPSDAKVFDREFEACSAEELEK